MGRTDYMAAQWRAGIAVAASTAPLIRSLARRRNSKGRGNDTIASNVLKSIYTDLSLPRPSLLPLTLLQPHPSILRRLRKVVSALRAHRFRGERIDVHAIQNSVYLGIRVDLRRCRVVSETQANEGLRSVSLQPRYTRSDSFTTPNTSCAHATAYINPNNFIAKEQLNKRVFATARHSLEGTKERTARSTDPLASPRKPSSI